MISGIKISSNKKKNNKSPLSFYNRPKLVYIPLISGNDTNITVVVKKGDYVYKGSIVGKRKGNFRIPLHSSVSGTVIDFTTRTSMNGEFVKCVVIENDFKEKVEEKQAVRKKINNYSKKEFIDILQNCGIVGMGGAGFPTYIKYNTDKKIHTLIINAVECEPEITADFALVKEKCEEILEAIDAVMEINKIDESVIAIKKCNVTLETCFNNYLGTYPKIRICLVPNIYPMGWERSLVEIVKKVDYQKVPIEQGIVVNNVSTMYAIYEALKFNKPLIERIVTFAGDVLKKPQNVYVKVGTPVSEIIESIDGYKRNKDIVFVAGGPMMGTSLPNDDLVIAPNLNCVLAMKENNNEQVMNCIRCGKCVEHCPAHLSPVLIKDSLKRKDDLKELQVNKCIECGLCSYICPSKINVRGCVIQAKEKLKEEGK